MAQHIPETYKEFIEYVKRTSCERWTEMIEYLRQHHKEEGDYLSRSINGCIISLESLEQIVRMEEGIKSEITIIKCFTLYHGRQRGWEEFANSMTKLIEERQKREKEDKERDSSAFDFG